MSTVRATADTTPVTLFSVPKIAKGKLTSVKVDNQGAAAVTVRLRDRFVPDASAGVPSPVEQIIDRVQLTVGAGLTGTLSSEELKDTQILGTCETVANVTDAATVIIVSYHFL